MRLACVLACLLGTSPLAFAAQAQPATSPSAGQLNLAPGAAPRPAAVPYAPAKPGSPVVQQLVGGGQTVLVVRKRAHAVVSPRPRHRIARRAAPTFSLERPALAGVTLLQPLPPPPPVPHFVVSLPAYPLESVAAAYFTPPPPIVCHHTARIRDLPDPDLYRERTLICEPDTP